MPRPGKGIAEYREVARLAHRSVAGALDSLEALKSNSTQGSSELARFDRAVEQLELTSIKARARAEAIIARGQHYFDEWKEQLTTMTNQPAAAAQTRRYDRLLEHFTVVRERSSEVREEFRPFMGKLRQFRARLDQPSSAAQLDSRAEIDALAASGRRVLKTLDAVSAALNDADVELHAMRTLKA